MNVDGYYKQAVLYPFIAVMLCSIVFAIVDNYNYKSEWLTAGSVIMLSIIWSFFYSSVMCSLSLTIFLNKIKIIRANTLLVLLSWFLLPFSFIALVINHEVSFSRKYEAGKSGGNLIYILILNLPFVIGLVWSYVGYMTKRSR